MPYERLYGQKPNLSNLPKWGQNVWVYNPKGSKLDADTLQHQLYMYSDRSGEPENRSRGDRAEWMPTTERVGGIPLPNQI